MKPLTKDDLLSLEDYSKQRDDFRTKVMAHKKKRQVYLGEHAAFYFEDRLTMHYQVQEMLRAERIFEQAGIQDELDAYNPLIPGGKDLRATFMLQYKDVNARIVALAKLVGIEKSIWMQVEGFDKVTPIANEDITVDQEDNKTSAIHYLRFPFTDEMIMAAKEGKPLSIGIDHQQMKISYVITDDVRTSLVSDFD